MKKLNTQEQLIREVKKLQKKGLRVERIEVLCDCDDHFELVKKSGTLNNYNCIVDYMMEDVLGAKEYHEHVNKRMAENSEIISKVSEYLDRYDINKFKMSVNPSICNVDDSTNSVRLTVTFHYKRH